MVLDFRRDAAARDVVRLPGHERDELDLAAQHVERHRERRRLLLAAQRGLEVRVAAVDAHAVARQVGRREEREPHDVVPVRVRHEDVVGAGLPGALPQRGLAERAQAAAHVAEQVFAGAGVDLHARRMPPEGPRRGEVEAVDVGGDLPGRLEALADGPGQRADQLVADLGGGQRHRQRAAGAPEADAHPLRPAR